MNDFRAGRPPHRIFHAGELEAHRRFGVVDEAQATSDIVVNRLSLGIRRFIESLPFFFISSVDPTGTQMACGIVSRRKNAEGDPLPLLRAAESKTLLFALPPCADGDASGGHLHEGGGVGLLFVDFQRGVRYRINGSTHLLESDPAGEWPADWQVVELGIAQAYGNCNARVVRLMPAPA